MTFRFAVHIDCHEGWPRALGRISLEPEFRRLVETAPGEPFEDVGGLR